MRDGRRHAARWLLSERVSERGALSRPDGDGDDDNGFLRGANMPQHSFLGAGQSAGTTGTGSHFNSVSGQASNSAS